MFAKNIRIFYFYLVSFLALMALVAGTVSLVEKVTNYIYPVQIVYNDYNTTIYPDTSIYSEKYNSTTETIDITTQEKNRQIRVIKELLTSIAVILVSAPIYKYHWKVIQEERKNG